MDILLSKHIMTLIEANYICRIYLRKKPNDILQKITKLRWTWAGHVARINITEGLTDIPQGKLRRKKDHERKISSAKIKKDRTREIRWSYTSSRGRIQPRFNNYKVGII